jgi:pimeloyl-ACP methyl ester carboxylesterase
MLGIALAARTPDRVRTLTLISPAMPFLDPRRTAQGPVLPLLALPRADRLFAWGMARLTVEEMAEQVLEACFGDATRATPQRRAEATEEIRLRYTVAHYPKAYLGTLRGLV